MTLHSGFEFGSAVAALAAALLWFRSAKVRLPSRFPMTVVAVHLTGEPIAGAEVLSTGSSAEIDQLGRAMIRQGRLSAQAAGAAGIAAALQGIALLLS